MKPKIILCLALAFVAWVLLPNCPAGEITNSLSEDAYVWQRDWNQPVREAVAQYSSNFESLVVLNAEVSWREKQPQVIRVPLDYAVLTNANVVLALRIGPYPGPFSSDDKTTTLLTGLAAALVTEAKSNGLNPRELQIDFDCAESKLDGYRVWVEAIRRKIAPVPLTITVLPSWLNQTSFGKLVAATDGYVLQVHSLEAPKSADAPFTLCDPLAAQRAVERAGKYDVPFRVALPTYGYIIAFDQGGKFVGLSAEGPNKAWPQDVQLREVRTDPMAMARLVETWTTNHPTAMRGIIWYRLPVTVDNLNWRWPTLAAIVARREPHESFHATARRVEAGLVEISLMNDGELDISSRLAVEVRWSDARLIAGDGLRDFELAEQNGSAARFQNQSSQYRLPAGEKQIIGWLRFDKNREVQLEVKKF
jgi:hypothetical protein